MCFSIAKYRLDNPPLQFPLSLSHIPDLALERFERGCLTVLPSTTCRIQCMIAIAIRPVRQSKKGICNPWLSSASCCICTCRIREAISASRKCSRMIPAYASRTETEFYKSPQMSSCPRYRAEGFGLDYG
jgi:hypothetical protein